MIMAAETGRKGRQRYALLDVLRGAAIISMVMYHAVWDMVYIFHIDLPWYKSAAAYYWQQSICWSFIFLSGFCQALGRQRWLRGLVVFAAGLAVSAATLIFMPGNYIMWGVLTLLGSGMLLLKIFSAVLDKVSAGMGLAVSLMLFALTRHIAKGYIGLGSWVACVLPEGLYANIFTAFLGFPPRSFHSADYFALFPWLFLYLAGYYCSRQVKARRWSRLLARGRGCGLDWLGRRSLAIYLLHQPVLYGILLLYFD